MKTQSRAGLRLISSAFKDGDDMPIAYTCRGHNISPPLAISGVPADAKSLALIMHDPDAVNGDFTHWLLWDIPTSVNNLAADSVPAGAVQGLNDAGQANYLGPCPPKGSGNHRYIFELYALDNVPSLPARSNRDPLEAAIEGHALDQTTLTGMFAAEAA